MTPAMLRWRCRRPRGGADPRPEVGDVGEQLGARAIARQAGEQRRAVALARDAPVEHGDHARVGARADQAAEALLERQRRARQLVALERIAVVVADAIDARRGQRIVGDRERDAVHDDQRQRLARDVDALPEALRRQQHRADARAHRRQQHVARALALHQQRVRQRCAQQRLGDAQVAEAGEQQQRAPVRDRAQLRHARGGGGGEVVVVGLGQIGRDVQQRLAGVVERRRERRLGRRVAQADARAQVVEATRRRSASPR